MPQYALLIYDNEAQWPSMPEADQKKLMDDYWAYTESLQKAKAYVAGEALQPTATATSVQVRDGKTLTTDGPFAETKEQLGGFYIVDAKDLDEAQEWAAKIPSSKFGTIEVRPIMQFDEEGNKAG